MTVNVGCGICFGDGQNGLELTEIAKLRRRSNRESQSKGIILNVDIDIFNDSFFPNFFFPLRSRMFVASLQRKDKSGK